MDDNSKKIKDLLDIQDTWERRKAAALKRSADGEHAWFEFSKMICCAKCGYVKNPKNSVNPCKRREKLPGADPRKSAIK